MSTFFVACSATGAPIPTPALLTSTSRRPKRSRWRGDDVLDLLLGGHVGRDLLDVVARVAQLLRGAGQLLGPAGGDREAVALLAEHVRDREPDPARGAGDEGCAVGHGAATYTLSGDEHSVHGRARPARPPARRGLRVRRRGGGERRQAAPGGRPEPAAPVATIASRVERIRGLRFETPPAPAEVSPAAGEARRARGPRPLLPRRRAPRRRGGAQAARAARAVGRPARRVGDRVRPGRRGLLRPAHQAPADRARRTDHQPASSRRSRSPTSSPTRSRTSASGSTSRTPRAPTTPRSPGSRWSRAAPPR